MNAISKLDRRSFLRFGVAGVAGLILPDAAKISTRKVFRMGHAIEPVREFPYVMMFGEKIPMVYPLVNIQGIPIDTSIALYDSAGRLTFSPAIASILGPRAELEPTHAAELLRLGYPIT